MSTPKSEMPDLKPCPFCRATPHRGPAKVQRDQLHGEPYQLYRIWCPKEHAQMCEPSEADAIAAWNRRAPASRLSESGEGAGERLCDWIEWHGGECPVPAGTLVHLRFRSGRETAYVQDAANWQWEHWGGRGEIIAYRLDRPHPTPRQAESAPEPGEREAIKGEGWEDGLGGFATIWVGKKSYSAQQVREALAQTLRAERGRT